MINNPLRYEIANWYDLTKCLSNNSKQLSIHVSKFLGEDLSGTIIEVKHSLYGTLFATTVGLRGRIIDDRGSMGEPLHELSKEEILDQIARFGFYVTYVEEARLTGSQLLVLMSVRTLGYTLINRINVIRNIGGQEMVTPYVVAFNADSHSNWLKYSYTCKISEYEKALAAGTALYVDKYYNSDLGFVWDWLTYVATIDQILEVNANPGD